MRFMAKEEKNEAQQKQPTGSEAPSMQGMAADKAEARESGKIGSHETGHDRDERTLHAVERNEGSVMSRGGVHHRDYATEGHPLSELFDDDMLADPFGAFRFPEHFLQMHGMRRMLPRVDVSQNDKEVRVAADLPGIDPDQIDIQVEHDALVLRGSFSREEKGERPFRYERVTGSFKRRIMLPAVVRPDDVMARYKDGVLTIVLPKEERHNKVRIERE